MSNEDDVEIVTCPNCGAEFENDSYCAECGYGQEVGELVEAMDPKPEPVYARSVEPRSLPVHEPAWCPHCLAWLGTFASRQEARAYEASLETHPVEYCMKRLRSLSGSEMWRLRHEAQRFGSLAATSPAKARIPPEVQA